MKRTPIASRTLAVTLAALMTSATAGLAQEETNVDHLNKVIPKLERGRLVTGTWVMKPTIANALGLLRYNGYPTRQESLAEPMIDFAVVEMEHAPFNAERLHRFVVGLSSTREAMASGDARPSIATLVRIPADGDQPVHAMIKQVLDMGAYGVVVPHVRTAAEARKIVRACRYPQPPDSEHPEPAGRRGAAPLRAAYAWGVDRDTYLRHADVWPLNPKGDLMAVLMIEDREAVESIEKIVSVPGVGAVMFGPFDYSFASGHYGDVGAEAVDEAREKVREACQQADVPFIDFAGADNIERKLEREQDMLLLGNDLMSGVDAVHGVHEHLRQRE